MFRQSFCSMHTHYCASIHIKNIKINKNKNKIYTSFHIILCVLINDKEIIYVSTHVQIILKNEPS
jgi:hypothetical protein